MKFLGPADATPRVMVVNGPVTRHANGTGEWRGPPLHLKAVRTSRAERAGVAEFVASSELHHDKEAADEWLQLVPGAPYHYFISNAGSPLWQDGTFTTQAMVDPGKATLEPQPAPIKTPGVKIPTAVIPAKGR